MFVWNIWSSCVLCQQWSGANWGSPRALFGLSSNWIQWKTDSALPWTSFIFGSNPDSIFKVLVHLIRGRNGHKRVEEILILNATKSGCSVRHWIYSALVIMWQGRGRITRIANLRHIYCSLSTQANRPPCQIMDYISREWAKETHLIDLQLCTVDDGTLARLKERRWPPRPGCGELVASNRQLRALPCRVQWCLVARHFSTWLLGSWGNSQGQRSQAPRKSQRWTWWVLSSCQISCRWS